MSNVYLSAVVWAYIIIYKCFFYNWITTYVSYHHCFHIHIILWYFPILICVFQIKNIFHSSERILFYYVFFRHFVLLIFFLYYPYNLSILSQKFFASLRVLQVVINHLFSYSCITICSNCAFLLDVNVLYLFSFSVSFFFSFSNTAYYFSLE